MNNKFILLLIAYTAFVVLGMLDGLLGIAWPTLRAAFNQPVDALGLLLAFSMVGHITASFANGRLITRYGIASLLLGSATLMGSGMLTQVVAPLWPIVLFGGVLVGLGGGMLDAGVNTYSAANFRPRLINWLHACFSIGTTLGSLLMTTLLAWSYDWRAGFASVALMHATLFLIFWMTRARWRLKPEEQEALEQSEGTDHFATNRETLRLPTVWISIIIFFFYTGIEVGTGTWAFTLLTESRGLSETAAGFWTTAYWGSFMAARILLGFIEANLNRLVRFGLVGIVLGALLLALNLTPWVGLAGLVLIGISNAPIFPALVAYTPQRVGREHAPNAIGFEIGAAGLGAAAVPGLAGVLGDTFGLELIPWYLMTVGLLQVGLHELLIRSGEADEKG